MAEVGLPPLSHFPYGAARTREGRASSSLSLARMPQPVRKSEDTGVRPHADHIRFKRLTTTTNRCLHGNFARQKNIADFMYGQVLFNVKLSGFQFYFTAVNRVRVHTGFQ